LSLAQAFVLALAQPIARVSRLAVAWAPAPAWPRSVVGGLLPLLIVGGWAIVGWAVAGWGDGLARYRVHERCPGAQNQSASEGGSVPWHWRGRF
jgi:hypothetical protein